MAEETCPSCGNRVPRETAMHARAPGPGLVACPHCGASVTLSRPGEPERATRDASGEPETVETPARDSFAGHETIEGVMDEVRAKEDG
jgi:hypothetical protein